MRVKRLASLVFLDGILDDDGRLEASKKSEMAYLSRLVAAQGRSEDGEFPDHDHP